MEPHSFDQPKFFERGLRILQELLRLQVPDGSCDITGLEDVVFVAIDFEDIERLRRNDPADLDSRAGVAILDPRDLRKKPPPSNVISTFNFVSGSQASINRATRTFLFGQTSVIDRRDLVAKIETLIPASRKVILVGHSVIQEVRTLTILGFDFRRIHSFLDTYRLAQEFGTCFSTLGDLCVEFDLQVAHLHCAGNDAHYALRLLLLIALNGPINMQFTNTSYLKALGKTAYMAIPVPPSGHYHHIKIKTMHRKRRKGMRPAELRRMAKSAKFREKLQAWCAERKERRERIRWDPEAQAKHHEEKVSKREAYERESEEVADAMGLLETYIETHNWH